MMTDDEKSEIKAIRARMHDLNSIAQNLVTRDATMAVQVTNLVASFTEHRTDSKAFMDDARESLAKISEQVTKTNGRVNGHDQRFVGIDREIRELKRPHAIHEAKRVTDRSDAITLNIPINAKTVTTFFLVVVGILVGVLKAKGVL
jgi:hypothetical protein